MLRLDRKNPCWRLTLEISSASLTVAAGMCIHVAGYVLCLCLLWVSMPSFKDGYHQLFLCLHVILSIVHWCHLLLAQKACRETVAAP